VLASKFTDKDKCILKYDKLKLETFVSKIILANSSRFEVEALQKMGWDLYVVLPLDFLQSFLELGLTLSNDRYE
jgi:hypothetical protein